MAVSLILRQPPLLFAQFSPFGLLSSRPMAFQPMPLSRRPQMSDGKDLRTERLTDRKHELRRLLSKVSGSRMRYVEHVEGHGKALFERVCKLDMEGIVAKHSSGPYVTETRRTTWFKVKNRSYSQMEGREKLFERERHQEPVPGWHNCDLACQ